MRAATTVNRRTTLYAWLLTLTVFVVCIAAAVAQTAAPPPLAGSVVKLDGRTLHVKSTERDDVTATLAPDARIITSRSVKLTEVKASQFIGTTAVEREGKLYSTEVHIFPEEMRGTGEGHYPWGGAANTTMTNGNVATMTNGNVATMTAGNVEQKAGAVLRVQYQGGEREVLVGPDVPVTLMVVSDTSVLTPGTQVLLFGAPAGDGTLAAQMVVVTGPPAAH